jgi:peptidoglycan/LPS O-acetylase OafA/YrhL
MIFSKTNNFDLIRLFAALQVMLFHQLNHFDVLEKHTYLSIFLNQFPGVPVFFFISGFLITSSFNNNQNNITNYFKNRAIRIFPALWVCLIFTIIILFLFNQIEWNNIDFYKWILAQSTFLQYYTPNFLKHWGIGTPNGSLWSIVVELQFYLLIPVLCWVLNKQKSKLSINIILISIYIISFLLRYYINVKVINNPNFDVQSLENQDTIFFYKLISTSVFCNLYYFTVGIFFYYNFDYLKKFFENKALFWCGIYLVYILYFALYKQSYLSPNHYNIYAQLSIVLLAITTFSLAFTNQSITKKILRKNDISYGIYIYHMPIVNAMIGLNIKGTILKVLISSIIVVNLAILSWVFVEKRILLLKKAK